MNRPIVPKSAQMARIAVNSSNFDLTTQLSFAASDIRGLLGDDDSDAECIVANASASVQADPPPDSARNPVNIDKSGGRVESVSDDGNKSDTSVGSVGSGGSGGSNGSGIALAAASSAGATVQLFGTDRMVEGDRPDESPTFANMEDLFGHLWKFGIHQGYAVTKARTRSNVRLTCTSMTVFCDCSRKKSSYVKTKTGIPREGKSRALGCPFKIKTSRNNGAYRFEVICNFHNHDIGEANLLASPAARRFNQQQQSIIQSLSARNLVPLKVHEVLTAQYPSMRAGVRQVSDAISGIKRARRGGRTCAETLIAEGIENGHAQGVVVDENNRLRRLFFAPQESIELVDRNPHVLLVDCTYKTNSLYLPLANIVGISCTGESFYAGFAFLPSETTEDYVWLMRQIKEHLYHGNDGPVVIATDADKALMNSIAEVFPCAKSMLGSWHIGRNVKRHCLKHMNRTSWPDVKSAWNRVVYSHTEAMFESEWASMCHRFKKFPRFIAYVKEQWISLKERFVVAWTKDYAHFGVGTTQRVEGMNAMLKEWYLRSNAANLLTAVQNLELAMIERADHLEKSRANDKGTHWTKVLSDKLFSRVCGLISHRALAIAFDNYKAARKLIKAEKKCLKKAAKASKAASKTARAAKAANVAATAAATAAFAAAATDISAVTASATATYAAAVSAAASFSADAIAKTTAAALSVAIMTASPSSLSDKLIPACRGVSGRTLGTPCVHDFYNMIKKGKELAKEDFHAQWLLNPWLPEYGERSSLREFLLGECEALFNRIQTADQLELMRVKFHFERMRNEPMQRVYDPVPRERFERPAGLKNKSHGKGASTRRELTETEVAERLEGAAEPRAANDLNKMTCRKRSRTDK